MTAINQNSKANTLYTHSQLDTVAPPPNPWRKFNKSTRYVQFSWPNGRTRLKPGDGDVRTFENAENVYFIVRPGVKHIQAIYNFAFLIIFISLNIPGTQTVIVKFYEKKWTEPNVKSFFTTTEEKRLVNRNAFNSQLNFFGKWISENFRFSDSPPPDGFAIRERRASVYPVGYWGGWKHAHNVLEVNLLHALSVRVKLQMQGIQNSKGYY